MIHTKWKELTGGACEQRHSRGLSYVTAHQFSRTDGTVYRLALQAMSPVLAITLVACTQISGSQSPVQLTSTPSAVATASMVGAQPTAVALTSSPSGLGLSETVQTLFYLVSLVGIGIAYLTYRGNAKVNRARWLLTLFEKFYEQPNYKRVRAIIDQELQYELSALARTIVDGADYQLEEEFVDYLNFFEFIASLWRKREISLQEIDMLFGYYIKRLSSFDFIRKYIATEGFENLDSMMKHFEQRRTA